MVKNETIRQRLKLTRLAVTHRTMHRAAEQAFRCFQAKGLAHGSNNVKNFTFMFFMSRMKNVKVFYNSINEVSARLQLGFIRGKNVAIKGFGLNGYSSEA